ncbi:alpha/beta fold hydrolase [Streptomyces polyrhachis]|uniref:Alpha/beta fold hydrolase n=1 Tax=Streptomyces polyrhachis TaxID=1282885 RepID=A0ABW2GBS1_9ACTN
MVGTTGDIQVPGGHLHSECAGEGTALVLLNAGSADLRMWESNMAALTARHRVIRYDDRNVGRHSSPAGAPWSYSADLLAVLDHWGVERATLVGASDGGRKALDFAVEHPERVERLVLTGCALALPHPDHAEQAALEALLTALVPRSEAVERGDLPAAVAADLAVWAPCLTPPQRARLAEIYADSPAFLQGSPVEPIEPNRPGIAHLAEIKAPVLVLVGSHDTPYTHHCAERIASGAPDADLIVVPAADHFINVSRPEDFHRLVLTATGATTG